MCARHRRVRRCCGLWRSRFRKETAKPTAQLRLVTPTQRRLVREPVVDSPVINLTLAADDRPLRTVGKAAHRLGIGRSFTYELVAAGQIETIHVGQLCKEFVDGIAAFIERQSARSLRGV